MSWFGDYVGVPFRPRGRTRAGADCWGLVRLVWAEQRGLILPDLGGEYHSTRDGAALAPLLQAQLPAWEKTTSREFAVALFTLPDGRLHVGVLVDDARLLHTSPDSDAVVERLASPQLTICRGFYWPHDDAL